MQLQTTAHGGEQTFPQTPTFIGVLTMSRFRKLDSFIFLLNGGGERLLAEERMMTDITVSICTAIHLHCLEVI